MPGITQIEILITIFVSGIVMIGLGTLFTGAAGEYATLARMREER